MQKMIFLYAQCAFKNANIHSGKCFLKLLERRAFYIKLASLEASQAANYDQLSESDRSSQARRDLAPWGRVKS